MVCVCVCVYAMRVHVCSCMCVFVFVCKSFLFVNIPVCSDFRVTDFQKQ